MSTTLLEVLAAEGAAEARAVLDKARRDAAAIDAATAQRVRVDLETRLGARSEELRLTESAERVKARAGARESGFRIRERVVNDLLQRTRRSLADTATDAWLLRQVEAVIDYLPKGGVELRCAQKDLAAVERVAAGRHETAVTVDAAIQAGVVAAMSDGSLRVDGTAEARLERMRAALAIEIVRAVEER